ncbi:phosphoribosylformylglycinamidine cyclo-ligase [Candidatus Uhrbacteria bacterium RIFCSPLOWO2_01_FULL_47_24]|uniref:Phosphoribosylformylglycinamidine cyclo-ligase n=1 Tax=Candidatus Uhrbacteria bacterium RIFCSPLOWO2_01_FULL_47_24 TaxID=1802401 RepID=A0A1F7UU61_9BACT|nr:MAG: phosphoribosylformylglycinamidine cyclo-ligase [Candidatus Uhrbacteria bacterium RIFCSPHIGHO2_01_FULL_47_11]OGL68640.1 MAG: phosphoribosylformylglycinamidine cyclo-ligase [Candidatus Uhrbacteria bacterium RIFCSPHIGHO2_02_FULL_46_47]OGL81207.1 MAG: phosphoribosylformylglycinamidine cyclo-ligase [Candidatus Uhrbacteria bacterium RIFCSPLOWO2_01_FULL_47_24]OGL84629.1 MAG: phosphoribosylformylglycinamidine cyclo-ligase [Candidatus Uhrbacteria bacterium RIFCSPLOWO2_02_FULL_46_25]OGL93215.1 MA
MSEKQAITYAGTGVDYDAMDPFKREAQLAAMETAINVARLGLSEVLMSRGESAYLIDAGDRFLAHVEEGLGTKNLVADAMYKLTGKSYYDQIAQDTVAMIVNDMITLGALPLSVAMHLAVGASDWFQDTRRCSDLIHGWKQACILARCVWGGGETPTLKGVVVPEAVVLSGSAIGLVQPKERLITPSKIQHGDAIVLVESSGIHANGLTMARTIADNLPEGYLTQLPDGRTYGEALLDPTYIYVALVEDCLNHGVSIHYTVNITGHGWRKLMRAREPFVYLLEKIPEPQPIFRFIQECGPVNDTEMYGNFNMGAGFALYVPTADVEQVITLAEQCDFKAMRAGHIEKRGEEKKVVIQPKGLEYDGSTLGVR